MIFECRLITGFTGSRASASSRFSGDRSPDGSRKGSRRSHHVRPGFRTRDDGGAIRKMHDSGVNAQCTQTIERRVKPLFLFACLLSDAVLVENFRRSKMGKNTGKLQMFALRELPRQSHSMSEVAMPSRSYPYRFSNERERASCRGAPPRDRAPLVVRSDE